MFVGRKSYSRKEFNNIKNKDTEIVADTSFEVYNTLKHKRYGKLSFNGASYVTKPKIFGISYEFIEIDDNKFISVKKHSKTEKTITTSIIILLVILLLFLLDNSSNIDIPVIGGQDIEDYKEPTSSMINVDYIEIPSLERVYNLTSDNKEIYLINPDGNTVYFKYTLTINGEEILSTDYIEPNKMIKANLYDFLDKGTYEIEVLLSTKDITTLENCNGATLKTTVNVDK